MQTLNKRQATNEKVPTCFPVALECFDSKELVIFTDAETAIIAYQGSSAHRAGEFHTSLRLEEVLKRNFWKDEWNAWNSWWNVVDIDFEECTFLSASSLPIVCEDLKNPGDVVLFVSPRDGILIQTKSVFYLNEYFTYPDPLTAFNRWKPINNFKFISQY